MMSGKPVGVVFKLLLMPVKHVEYATIAPYNLSIIRNYKSA